MAISSDNKKSTKYSMAKFCSPSKSKLTSSCFRKNLLHEVVDIWNKKYPKKKISKSSDPKKIVSNLRKYSEDTPCQEEHCLLKNNFFRRHILGKPKFLEIQHDTFIPEMPQSWLENPKAWLSTTDIRDVLLQYEFKHPEFEFLGPTPIDFDYKFDAGGFGKQRCVSEEFCNIDIKKLYQNGKRHIGMVFNLDPHDMPGSHWVSAFVNLNNGGIFYFDSVGKFPGQEIQDLMFRIRNQGNQLLYDGFIPVKQWNTRYNVPVKFRNPSHQEYLEHRDNIDRDELVFIDSEPPPYLEDMLLLVKNKKSNADQKGGKLKKIIHRIRGVQEGGLVIETPKKDRHQIKHMDKEAEICGFRMFWNDKSMQRENTECGMYAIHFIHSLLSGKHFEEYTDTILRDGDLNEMRTTYYRPYIEAPDGSQDDV